MKKEIDKLIHLAGKELAQVAGTLNSRSTSKDWLPVSILTENLKNLYKIKYYLEMEEEESCEYDRWKERHHQHHHRENDDAVMPVTVERTQPA